MADTLKLKASDGHAFDAYLAQPSGKPRGGLVVIQEIFGVNSHMKSVADAFAEDGYLAICPALYDRYKPGIDLGYDEDDVTEGREIRAKVGNDDPLLDIAAAADAVRSAGRVGVVGYCWGGTLTWLAATKLDGFSVASSYYGGGIGGLVDLQPKCPVIFHFGEQDHAIPMDEVEKLRQAHPDLPVHVYPAGHGFNCDARGSYEPKSAEIARERTLEFFKQHMG
ncbi:MULTISPECIES: dienelactone hydrolase family protein [Thalassobaculum]|uniref:Carboxymethylenebutenolidase n=1 Tax=Thalassobaculum litoreum DSM 18839 TaxID=1123362 RepID=A0A8G2BFB3_9PROT|nr:MULTISPECIES: dienelactone hydrolase family protein [Thalassobaculum]SDF31646.1 carboxymethylenebutenolidase [Thalassobaculum litoreum DSM 18839]